MGLLSQEVLSLLHPAGSQSTQPPELAYRASYWDELLAYTAQWNCQLTVLYRLNACLQTAEWKSVLPERTLGVLNARNRELQNNLTRLLEFGRKTLGVLESVRVPALVFKGADLALRCYPDANLRPMNDIDFMIPREQLASALRELGRAGYRRLDTLSARRIPLGHSDCDAKVVLYSGVFEGDAESESAEIWDRARTHLARGGQHPLLKSAGTLLFPNSEDGLALLFQTMVESAGPRSPLFLLDLHYWIAAETELDWDRFLFLLHRRNIEASAWFFLHWIWKEYGTQIPDSVLSVLERRTKLKVQQVNRWSLPENLFPCTPEGESVRLECVRFLTIGREASFLGRINPVRWLRSA